MIATVPAVISPALGMYCGFEIVLLGVNVPVPDEDQIPPEAIVTVPPNETVALLAHTDWFTPAFAVGAGVIFTVIVAVTAGQPPLLVEVRVNVTIPAETSEAVGTYVPVKALGAKVPVLPDVHVPEPVDEVPFKEIVLLLAQTTGDGPVLKTAGLLTVTETIPTGPLQPPALANTE